MSDFGRIIRIIWAVILGIMTFGVGVSLIANGMIPNAVNIILFLVMLALWIYNFICIKQEENLLLNALRGGGFEGIGDFFANIWNGIKTVFVYIGKGIAKVAMAIGKAFLFLFNLIAWPLKKITHSTSNVSKSFKGRKKGDEVELFRQEFQRKYGIKISYEQAARELRKQKEKERIKQEKERQEKEREKELEIKNREKEKQGKQQESQFLKEHKEEFSCIHKMVNVMQKNYYQYLQPTNCEKEYKNILNRIKTDIDFLTETMSIYYEVNFSEQDIKSMFDEKTGKFIPNPQYSLSVPADNIHKEKIRELLLERIKCYEMYYAWKLEYDKSDDENTKIKIANERKKDQLRIDISFSHRMISEMHDKKIADISFLFGCDAIGKNAEDIKNQLELNMIDCNVDRSEYEKYLK